MASGPEGFARLLTGLGVPFPLFNAWMVILVEVLCGMGRILSAWMPATALLTRLCALPLAVNILEGDTFQVEELSWNTTARFES